MFRVCSHIVRRMFADCSVNIQIVRRIFADFFGECSHIVRRMIADCSVNVRKLFDDCSDYL